MTKTGVRRLVCITSGGTHPGRAPTNPFFFERILEPLFHRLYDDMREMEDIVMASALDWTILRPPRLLDKPETRAVRIAPDTHALPGGATLSRSDLATAVVQQLTHPTLLQRAAAIAD